jgi:hypothetical protein
MQISTVEFCQKCMGEVAGGDIAVINSSVHVFDYNPHYKRRRSVVAFHVL